MKRRLLISILIITMSLAAITGGTLAWFTDTSGPIENTFTAGTLSITTTETVSWEEGEWGDGITAEFPERENWNPGDCDWKKFKITNQGSKRTYLRVKFETNWYEPAGDGEWDEWERDDDGYFLDAEGTKIVDEQGNNIKDPVTTDLGSWVQIGDYYYCLYTPSDPEGSDPTPILDSGKFIELQVDVCLGGSTATNPFQGKQYKLTATFEAIQVTHEAAFEQWDVGYVVTYNESGVVIDNPGWYPVAQNPSSDDRWEAKVGTDTYYWTRDGFEGGYWTKVGP